MMLEWDRTNEGSGIILDNKAGITDWKTLNEVERRYSVIRLAEFKNLEKSRKPIYDERYFLSIHKYLFQDIYPWAGTIREVDLYKENSAFAPSRFLQNSLDEFFSNLKKDNYLQGFTRDEVAELSSYYMLELNFIHPFREGNGRTKRCFMTELLKGAGYDLGLEKIDANQLVMADILAFDDNESGIKANPSYFKFLINSSIQPLKQNTNNLQRTSVDSLNRFLWVYDRYDSRAYFKSKNSLVDAEKKLIELLSIEQGKERIKVILDRIISNETKISDGTAEYRKTIINQAKEYKIQIDTNQIKKETAMTKKNNLEEEINKKGLSIADKLDIFYSYYDPYNRFDETGSFSSKEDYHGIGLKQIKEDLATVEGRKGIDNFLQDIIKTDERTEFVKTAKDLRLELLNPTIKNDSLSSFLETAQQKQEYQKDSKKESTKSQKKQQEIK